jgi:AcrR family transcriptional regulator
MEAEILRVAGEELARHGAAALSLRAVAREMGMASSAIYRYVRDRDELLTRLIVAAYTSLGDAVERAHDAVDPTDLDGRWRAVGTALRDWARAHPHEYALLYGSPVPDYRAPAEQTNEPGTRVQALLVRLLADAQRTGRLRDATAGTGLGVEEGVEVSAEAAAGPILDDPFFADAGLDAPAVMAGLAAWTLLLGTVTTELFEQLGDTIPDPGAYFAYMLELAGGLVLAPATAAVHS